MMKCPNHPDTELRHWQNIECRACKRIEMILICDKGQEFWHDQGTNGVHFLRTS